MAGCCARVRRVGAVKQCVSAGMGFAMLPAVEGELERGEVVALRWAGRAHEIPVRMIRHKDKRPSPALAAFLEASRETTSDDDYRRRIPVSLTVGVGGAAENPHADMQGLTLPFHRPEHLGDEGGGGFLFQKPVSREFLGDILGRTLLERGIMAQRLSQGVQDVVRAGFPGGRYVAAGHGAPSNFSGYGRCRRFF